jgi:hypothetical protein
VAYDLPLAAYSGVPSALNVLCARVLRYRKPCGKA